MIGPYQRTGRNVYDVRKDCGKNPLCYDEIGNIEKFLNKRKVQRELGAKQGDYKSCNFDVNRDFLMKGDW